MKEAAFMMMLQSSNLYDELILQPRPTDPRDYTPAPLASDLASATVKAIDIPIAHTPIPHSEKFPAPILSNCDEPLPEGVPDFRGMWEVYEGQLKGHVERIEQCGNRARK